MFGKIKANFERTKHRFRALGERIPHKTLHKKEMKVKGKKWTKSWKRLFFPNGSLCSVYSRPKSNLLKTNKARAHLDGGAPDSFLTENSYILGIEPGITRTELRVLTTELRRLYRFKIEMLILKITQNFFDFVFPWDKVYDMQKVIAKSVFDYYIV